MPMLPITERDYKDFGIKYFHEKKYEVSILESHQLLLPGYKNSVNIEYMKYKNHYEPSTFDELFEITSALSENDYIFFILGSKEAVALLNKIKNTTKARFLTYVSGSIPDTSAPCGLINKFKRQIAPIIRRYMYKYGLGTFESDLFITGSPKDELIYPFLVGHNTKKVHAHSRDYELCMHTNTYTHNRPYCVFLDADIIDSSDYVISEKKENKDILTYHNKLIDFFKWIQDNMNLDVIISAHPKSRIFFNKERFHGFKVVHQKSVSLVKGSQFVLTEGSTAVSFAVYFNKPMILFTMKEVKFFYRHTCSYAREFNKKVISIDNLSNFKITCIKDELKNMKKYEYFKYNYLTYDNHTQSVFEIIENELNY